MSSTGNFFCKEDELKALLESLNIPKEIAEKIMEQQKSNPLLMMTFTDLLAYIKKKESFMNLKYSSSDISTSASSPVGQVNFRNKY